MELLMITRKVDKADWLAGFTYGWVKKLAEEVDQLFVVCLEKGEIGDLPGNVSIYSLGKEKGTNRLRRLIKFKFLALKLVPRVDGVFCHMNPEYTIIIAPFAKIFRKKIVSWYTHATVSWRLKLMEKLANVVLTASAYSFRLPSKKLKIVGHGIDVKRFSPLPSRRAQEVTRILTVGRISPTKDYESMIKAVALLIKKGFSNLTLTIIGEAGLAAHQVYFENLRAMVKKMGLEKNVWFLGSAPHLEIPYHLQQSDIFINLSGTGSLDKAVLEAMACGCLVLTSNEAFKRILPGQLMAQKNDPQALAKRIEALIKLPILEADRIRQQLRQEVTVNHNLDNLVKVIVAQF